MGKSSLFGRTTLEFLKVKIPINVQNRDEEQIIEDKNATSENSSSEGNYAFTKTTKLSITNEERRKM